MARPIRARLVGAAAIALLAFAAAVLFLNRERGYDPDFDTAVADPAYRAGGPVVLFDEGHRNTHTTDDAYWPLAELLRNDGYALRVLHGPLTRPELEGVSVLVLALAR